MNINILPQNDCIVNLFLQKNLLKNSYFFHFFINLRKKHNKLKKSKKKPQTPKDILLPFCFLVFAYLLRFNTDPKSLFARYYI